MTCTVIYGTSNDRRHREEMPAADAFRFARDAWADGWTFVNIYLYGRLVYTASGLAGYSYICGDCEYIREA